MDNHGDRGRDQTAGSPVTVGKPCFHQAPKAKHYWLVWLVGHPSRQIMSDPQAADWTWLDDQVVPVLNDDVTKAAMLTPAQGLQLLGARSSEQGSVDAEFFISTAYLSYFNVNTCFNMDPYW